jgi:hypothetical protein
MRSLKIIGIGAAQTEKFPPAEFRKKYDAGEFGKPAPSPQPSPARGEGARQKLAYLGPAFQQWIKATQALPAEQQIEAVSKKLMELNPGFDGKLNGAEGRPTPRIDHGVVVGFGLHSDGVTDISPVRALTGLMRFNCSKRSTGTDRLSDLSPLAGMDLVSLECAGTAVADLTPLVGMDLTSLTLNSTEVSDLSPLAGMPLLHLTCYRTTVTDLSPLTGMKLKSIRFTPRNITRGLDVIRRMDSLKEIAFDGAPNATLAPAEFWRRYNAGEFGKPAPPSSNE